MALENVLLDINHPETGRRTRLISTEDGNIIVNDQDRTAILKANAIARSYFDKWEAYKANTSNGGWVRVASIPVADFYNLDRLGVTRSPERLRAFLNRSDARAFRVDDCRRL
jgi:hypothetical protein